MFHRVSLLAAAAYLALTNCATTCPACAAPPACAMLAAYGMHGGHHGPPGHHSPIHAQRGCPMMAANHAMTDQLPHGPHGPQGPHRAPGPDCPMTAEHQPMPPHGGPGCTMLGDGHSPATLSAMGAGAGPQGYHHRFDDPQRWSQVFDDPARDRWQRPDELVRWLALAPTARVADIGAGTGYFAVRLARAVVNGRVWAEDIEPSLVAHMQQRFARENISNAFALLGTEESPLLAEPVDLVLVVDTYHHISNRSAFFQRVRDRLRPGGRVVIVDFREDSPMGPPREHRLAPAMVTREMTEAGFRAGPTLDTLPNQYVLSFTAADEASTSGAAPSSQPSSAAVNSPANPPSNRPAPAGHHHHR